MNIYTEPISVWEGTVSSVKESEYDPAEVEIFMIGTSEKCTILWTADTLPPVGLHIRIEASWIQKPIDKL